MNIAPVDFIDVSRMAGALVMRHEVHFRDDTRRQTAPGSAHHDTQMILLRGPKGLLADYSQLEAQGVRRGIQWEALRDLWFADVPHEDQPLLADWPSARGVLAAIAESHRRRTNMEPIFGKAMVVSLKAGGFIDWHIDQGAYAGVHSRYHLCLVPSPAALVYSGGESAILPVGQLTFFNNHVLHSAANFGPVARIHLIVDVRNPPPQESHERPRSN